MTIIDYYILCDVTTLTALVFNHNLFLDNQLQYSVTLKRKGNGKLGFRRQGRQIEKVHAGSSADKAGKMKAGDKIVAINHIGVVNKDDNDISELINSSPSVVIALMREGKTLYWTSEML